MPRSRTKKEKPCLKCGVVFEYKNKNRMFCSLKCQQLSKKEETFVEEPGMVECQICKNIKAHDLTSHISNIHKMKIEEYKSVYNSPIRSDKFLQEQSERIKGNKNPAYQHNGKYSSLSDNFIYASMTNKQDVIDKISKSSKENGNNSSSIKYWIKQGFTQEEAKEKQTERQTTFSKEICIQKYGEIEGLEVWKKRQEKWSKSYKKSNFSKISQKLFWEIYEKMSNKTNVYFATLLDGKLDSSGNNNEFVLRTEKLIVKPDFYCKDTNKIIEFDGDYWHGERRGNQQRDKDRDNILLQEGFKILHISEREFKENSKTTIEKCLEFING